MLSKNLQRVLDLIKKTGDKVVVFSDSGDPYVVMDFTEYEKSTLIENNLANLTEDELLDKINRDIANWKSEQNQDYRANISEINDLSVSPMPEKEPQNSEFSDMWDQIPEEETEEDEDDTYYFEKV